MNSTAEPPTEQSAWTACPYGTADADWCQLNHDHGGKRAAKRNTKHSKPASTPAPLVQELTPVSFELVPFGSGAWAAVDARTAAMREEGERLIATRTETALAELRADQIRVLLARRERVDHEIAVLLRAEKDERQNDAAWLAWCKEEFGWGRSQAFARLNPAQIAKKRGRDADRQAAVRESRTTAALPTTSGTQPDREKHARLVIEMIREGFKALAKKNHPDVGGSNEDMAVLAAARDWGIAAIARA